jgi:hypothetical protein
VLASGSQRRRFQVLGAALGMAIVTSCTAPSAPQVWHVTDTFGPAGWQTVFYDMSALSANDMWATGYTCTPACVKTGGDSIQVLLVHWDGRSWRAVPAPGGLVAQTSGGGVSALAANDVWVGADGVPANASAPAISYVLHWTGRRWTARRFATGVEIDQVLAFSDNDVWAFGSIYGDSKGRFVPADYHFNGQTWQRFRLPLTATDAAASGPDDIWVTGQAATGTATSPGSRVAGFHWDGRNWRAFNLPGLDPLAARGPNLADIIVAGKGNIWIAYYGSDGHYAPPGLEHLTSGRWQQVPLPGFVSSGTSQEAITQDGCGGIWLANPAFGDGQQWLAHYSDGQWTRSKVGTGRSTTVTLTGPMTPLPGTCQIWMAAQLTRPHGESGSQQVAMLELRPPR